MSIEDRTDALPEPRIASVSSLQNISLYILISLPLSLSLSVSLPSAAVAWPMRGLRLAVGSGKGASRSLYPNFPKSYSQLMGSLKLSNVWVFAQLIFGPCWPMNQLNKLETSYQLRPCLTRYSRSAFSEVKPVATLVSSKGINLDYVTKHLFTSC